MSDWMKSEKGKKREKAAWAPSNRCDYSSLNDLMWESRCVNLDMWISMLKNFSGKEKKSTATFFLINYFRLDDWWRRFIEGAL